MRERVEAMKAIWTQEEAEYHGRYVDFDPIWSWPKPVQKPHPPVLVGGVGDKVLDRVVAYGDEWIPNRVKEPGRARRADRRAPAPRRGGRPRPHPRDGVRREGRSSALLERLEAVGVTRSLFYLRPDEPAEVQRQLDQLAEVAAAWAG